MSGLDLREAAAFAESILKSTGEICRRYFRTSLAVEAKADASPVTVADRTVEARLRAAIAGRYPEHGIVGEEQGSTAADAARVWVVDPIDGTKAFITGNPLFGTLVALLEHGRPVLGIVDMPALGERWIGLRGQGTLFRSGLLGPAPTTVEAFVRKGRPIETSVLRSTSPHYFNETDAPAFERLRRRCGLTLYGGDCYSYGQLAAGFVDLVAETGLAPYDFLALVPVVKGAGGIATDWSGRPLGLDSDGRVLMAADPALHAAALQLLTA